MAALVVRNLSEETHLALKQRAAANGRSTEAEVRSILEATVHPKERLKLGSAIVAKVREIGGVELDIRRDRSPIELPTFE